MKTPIKLSNAEGSFTVEAGNESDGVWLRFTIEGVKVGMCLERSDAERLGRALVETAAMAPASPVEGQ